jgi:hypothetical protein
MLQRGQIGVSHLLQRRYVAACAARNRGLVALRWSWCRRKGIRIPIAGPA